MRRVASPGARHPRAGSIPRHGLAPCENAAAISAWSGGGDDDSAAPVGAIRPAKPKQLGEDAALDIETAEFVDAPVQHTQPGSH